jgi:hypothetical protein
MVVCDRQYVSEKCMLLINSYKTICIRVDFDLLLLPKKQMHFLQPKQSYFIHFQKKYLFKGTSFFCLIINQ